MSEETKDKKATLTKSTKKKKKRTKRIKQTAYTEDLHSHASEYFSMLDVTNKLPNFYYRWVNKAGNQIAKRKAMGYQLVQGSMPEKAMTMGGSLRENADSVLMRIPREKAVGIHRRAVMRSNKRAKSLTTKKSQREYYEERLKQDNILDRLIKID